MANLKHLKWLIIPVFAILLMSHNAFATDVVPSGANASGWNGNPQVSCYAYFDQSTAIWTGWSNFCSVGSGSARVGVRAVSFRDKNGSAIWAYTGDYLQIQLTLTAVDTQYQPQIYYLPDDNANLQMISMKVDGSFTASEGKELILTYYAKYLGSNNPSELMMGSTTGREFLSWNTNSYILGGFSISAWHVEADNNDDVVAAIEQQTQQEQQAVDNISNQSADDYEMESANMSSLFSQFGGFVSAVNGASIGDCNIPANFNHIDLGILNLCANPVPDYVQVAVSIVSCMLIAPYLMNIIKRILSIADKIREV